MNGDEHRPTSSEHPTRRPIILIGAPSGAGNTVLSQQIIARTVPLFTELFGAAPKEGAVRYDLRHLPQHPPRNQILLVECATQKFDQLKHTEDWRRMLALMDESELVVHVALSVPRSTLARQYFLRIFTAPKRMHVSARVLQVSKYRNTLVYLLTQRIARSNETWQRFGEELAKEMPRVLLVRVLRSNGDYQIDVRNNAETRGATPPGEPSRSA